MHLPAASGLSVGKNNCGTAKKCVTDHLKRAAWAEKQRIQAFAFISSPNQFDLGWVLAGTLVF